MNFESLKSLLTDLVELETKQGEQYCFEALQQTLRDLSEQRSKLTSSEDQRERDIFRKRFLPILFESTFIKHNYEKPRGYPGDFISQEMIWEGRQIGAATRYCGTTHRGKLLSSLTLEMENCKANEERYFILQDIIKLEGFRIASIGAGSAIELRNIESKHPENYNIFLLDQDSGALNRAKKELKPTLRQQTVFQCDNVLRYILSENPSLTHSRDLVYLVGLIDYFKPKSAIKIIKSAWKMLDAGGLLVVTNAHPRNPSKFWMEYTMDWYLEYKNEQTMYELAEALDGVHSVELIDDPQKVYQYLKVRKA